MVSNIGIKVLSSLSIIILACFTMKNKRFENKSGSFYQIKSDTVSVEDSIQRAQWDEEERKYLDSACQSETEKANLDIKKNKLVYFHYFGMVEQYNGDAEMTELLKKYNIEVDSAFTSCTVPYHLQNCYAQIMRKEIDRKFGPNFIDSLREVSKLEYVKKTLIKSTVSKNVIGYQDILVIKSIMTFLKTVKTIFGETRNILPVLSLEKIKTFILIWEPTLFYIRPGKFQISKLTLVFKTKKTINTHLIL